MCEEAVLNALRSKDATIERQRRRIKELEREVLAHRGLVSVLNGGAHEPDEGADGANEQEDALAISSAPTQASPSKDNLRHSIGEISVGFALF